MLQFICERQANDFVKIIFFFFNIALETVVEVNVRCKKILSVLFYS